MPQVPQYPDNASPSDAVELLATDPGNTSGGAQPLGTTEHVTLGTILGQAQAQAIAMAVALGG